MNRPSSLPLNVTADDVVIAVIVILVTSLFGHLLWRKKKQLPPGVCYPPHLRSWVPFLGSALELRRGLIRDFILDTARKFNSPVFTAQIGADKCLFLADSSLVPIVFKDQRVEIDSLTLEKKFTKTVMGFTQQEVDDIFATKEVVDMVFDQLHQHIIKPGPLLSETLRKTQTVLVDQVMSLTRSSSGDSNGWMRHGMLEWVEKTVFDASAGSLLSMSLISENSEVLSQLQKFDHGVPLLFSEAPSLLTRNAQTARRGLWKILASGEFWDAASPLMKQRRATLDVSNHVLAKYNFGLFWATVANSSQAVFWTLYHILEDKNGAYDAILKEVQSVASKREPGRDWFTLEELDELTLIQSAFSEALRMYQTLFVSRKVTQDFIINPKDSKRPKYMVEKGTLIFSFPSTMHYDPELFDDPETFQYDRFLDPAAKTKKGTLRSSHLRPFGGGVHLCPGRKFISYEASAMLAMMLLQLDMRLSEESSPTPGVVYSRQGVNVAYPDRDPIMEVRVRNRRD